MRTKKEVINFLESKLGTKVKCVGNPDLDGQCVTLIKSLMEFLGVPDPYKARGHGKTAISAYLNEGIAEQGTGFLSVFSNKDMGGGYGHIWLNAGDGDGTFYESNGQKALTVTKGKTYKYDSVCNFDKYIQKADMSDDQKQKEIEALKTEIAELTNKLEQYKKQRDDARNDKKQLQLQINELKSNIQGCVNREDKLKTKMELMSGFEPGAKEFQKVIAGLEVKKTDGTDPTAQTVINSVTQKLTYRDDRIKELTEEITNLKEQKQKDPAGEAGKTAMRLSTPAIITFVATTIYQAYPVLGEMGVEIQAIAIFLTTLLTMVVDRWTHVSGKNNKLDGASHGLLKF